ncbi:MAG TPA: hypothetical protein VGO57_01370 [Verrucomicrobiae bacterium]|jgi:hypothetical protein
MKHKLNRGLAAAALLLCGTGLSYAQTADLTINTFDASADGTGNEWGTGTQLWDGSNGNPPGALLVTAGFSNSSDTPCTTYICLNGNPWYVGTAINFSQYKSIEFDIKWDTTSDISVSQFNDVSTIPLTATNSSGQTILNSVLNAGSIGGLEVDLCGGSGGQMAPTIITTNIPATAANGWVHMSIPINAAMSGLDGCSGIVFHKWLSQYSNQIANDFQGRFWIDNVMLQGTAGPPPPPTVTPLTKANQGLNLFASTEGNAFYDRQSVRVVGNTGKSWVGHATAGNPVTYSFTIKNFPQDPATYGCEAYLFLNPNPNFNDNAPDWNETNCVVAFIQQGATNAVMHFQYKVNEGNNNQMYSSGGNYTNVPGSWDGVTANYLETGDLGSVSTAGSAVGTWTLKFTSDTNVTLIAPDNTTSSFIIPPYNAPYFAETTGFNVYLGMQANNSATINKAVVYSSFTISGTATPFSANFMTNTILDTNAWDSSVSTGPRGVLIVPASAAYWASWSLPSAGYSLQAGGSLNNLSTWTSPSMYSLIGMQGINAQLVDSSELPAGNAGFFNLIQRTFTQLQILLPGETNAPGTATGKVGTPLPQSTSGFTVVTVNAVDASYHIINGVIDQIELSTTDSQAFLPSAMSMVNGTAVFSDSNGVLFQSTGSQTITATDISNSGIAPVTSSPVTVGP